MGNEGLEHPDITYCMDYGYPPNRNRRTVYEDEYYYSPRPASKKRLSLKRLPLNQQTLKVINNLNTRTAAMMTARLAYTRENIELPVEPNSAKSKHEA